MQRSFVRALQASVILLFFCLGSLAVLADDPGALSTCYQQLFGGDVDLRGATNGQAAIWNSSTRKWRPGSPAGGSVLFADGSAGAPSISFANEPATGFYRRDVADVGFTASGTLIWDLSPGGLYSRAAGRVVSLSSSGGVYFSSTGDGADTGDAGINRASAGNIGFYNSGGTAYEKIGAGGIQFGTDNTLDVGASGATRPRTVYAGTSVVTPKLVPAANVGWSSGSGTPEGAVTSAIGGFYTNTANGDAYTKTSGSGNTGWVLVGSGGGGGGTEYSCDLANSTNGNISIPDATNTVLHWDVANSNHGLWDSGANTRITMPVAGRYIISANVYWNTATSSPTYLLLFKNGAEIKVGDYDASGHIAMSKATWLVDASVNDYFEIYVYQSSGASKNIYADTYRTGVSAYMINGGGGGGATDAILDCPSLLAYYSGASGLFTDTAGTAAVSGDGDAVKCWKDKGQYKINIATSGTASTYKTSNGTNSLPAVLFASSNLVSVKEAACGGPDFCVVAAISRPWTTTGFHGIFANNAPFGTSTGNGVYANTNGASGFSTQGFGIWGNGYNGSCLAVGPHGLAVDNTWVIATFLCGRASDVRVNGVSVASTTKSSLITSPYGVFNVGSDSVSDGPTYFDGRIGDMVILAGTVGPKQIEAIEDKLGTRWSISITHP